MKQDTRPLYQPRPAQPRGSGLAMFFGVVLLAWLMVALYGAAFIIHAIAGAL